MVLALGACHDELLNPVPESVLTTVNAFNTAKDMDLAVLGVYNAYKQRTQTDYELMEMPSDNMYAFYFATAPGIEEITLLQVNPENAKLNSFWKNTYNGIFRANSVLANIEKPTDYAAGKKEQYIGEAKFMRASMAPTANTSLVATTAVGRCFSASRRSMPSCAAGSEIAA